MMDTSAPLTLVHALRLRAEATPDAPAFRTLLEGGSDAARSWTWREWHDASRRVASGLRALGVRTGDRIGVLAGAVPLWPIVDLGAQWAGAVSVGLYPTSATAQVVEVLADCGARVAFAGSEEHHRRLVDAASELPALEWIVRADGVPDVVPDVDTAAAPSEGSHSAEGPRRLTLAELGETAEADATLPLPDDADADAVLIYTSGSTGTPRGARISHRTLVASAESVRRTLGLVPTDRALSFLPFCHAAERIFGLATRLVTGMECALVPDAKRVFEASAAYRPTIFGGLPRFYEKIHEAELAERGPDAPAPSPVVARLTGGAVRLATSGGAALPTGVAEGLDRLGMTVLGAYGLTEHLCVAFNRPGDHRFDDVGTAMPGTEIRIAEDGEILVRRSELTFSGYHGRLRETAAAFTDDGAWLRTGDLGRLDADGRLRVTGRKKELIALSTGKKVAPIRIEAALVAQPWIEHAVLVGEGRKFIGALLTLRRGLVEQWAADRGLDLHTDAPTGDTHEPLVGDPRVLGELERQVDVVNEGLSRTESVRKFAVLPGSLSVEAGELTPTLKVRRDVVLDRHAGRVEQLYREVAS